MNLENLRAEDVARIFLRLALIVLGVYLVVRAILVLFGLGGDAVTQSGIGGVYQPGMYWQETVFYALPLLVIGGLLVTVSRRLARLLYPAERPALAKRAPEPPAVCPSCGLPYAPGDYDPDAPEWHCARCGARLGP